MPTSNRSIQSQAVGAAADARAREPKRVPAPATNACCFGDYLATEEREGKKRARRTTHTTTTTAAATNDQPTDNKLGDWRRRKRRKSRRRGERRRLRTTAGWSVAFVGTVRPLSNPSPHHFHHKNSTDGAGIDRGRLDGTATAILTRRCDERSVSIDDIPRTSETTPSNKQAVVFFVGASFITHPHAANAIHFKPHVSKICRRDGRASREGRGRGSADGGGPML